MACSKCKQDKKIIGEEKFQRRSNFVDKWGGWFLLIWSLFAVYGIYSLISKLL
jgi:hypothetical protein